MAYLTSFPCFLPFLQALTSASLVVFTKTYIGYGVIALLIELHSSALHSRVLFKMFFGPSISINDSKYYKWIKYLNMVFFFLFRFSALIYMSYGLWRDRLDVPNLGIYLFMALAVAVIFFLSILLFVRVFKSDFMTPAPVTDKTFQAIKEGLVIPGVTPLPSSHKNNKKTSNDASVAAKNKESSLSSPSSVSSISTVSTASLASMNQMKTTGKAAVST